jgi:putative hydrolase of the HAD superfamily
MNQYTQQAGITTLFLDIGGVLLTNGWGHESRQRAADMFGLDFLELDTRHRLNFDTYETGKLTLDEYLNRVVFYEPRSFTIDAFRAFMFAQSKPYPEMIGLIQALKQQYGLKIMAVSNEGRELNNHRFHAFGLTTFVDFFVSSCYVHLRKPDADIFWLALDLAQTPTDQILYIDDQPMFVSVAKSLGIRGIRHIDVATTQATLAEFGLHAITNDKH